MSERVPPALLPAFRTGSPLAEWRKLPGQILATFSDLMRDSAGLLRLPCEGFLPTPPPSVLFPDAWKRQKPVQDRFPVFDDRLAGYSEPVPPSPAERPSPLMIYAAWQGEPVEAPATALKTALPPVVEVEPAAPGPVQGLFPFDGRYMAPFTGSAIVSRDPEVLYPEGHAKPPASGLKTLPEPKALPIKEEAARLAAPFLANWKNTVRLWGQGPSDLKWLTLALPLIVALVVFSAKGRLGGSAPPAAESGGVLQEAQPAAGGSLDSALNRQWAEIRRTILDRAAVVLSDDFRAGLGEWEGKPGWSEQWSYDPSGFVRTGPLALFSPSTPMENYRLDFLGQIERRSLGWVVRAADIENYYAMKLTVVRPGPLPNVVLEQFAVIGGKEGPRRQVPLPMQVRTDTMYRVRMEVNGDGFTTYVQGQMVDFFSDGRLKRGGVGFFSAKGEQARVRWIEVQHQYDTLGRLCAFLAPMNLPSKDGGSKQ